MSLHSGHTKRICLWRWIVKRNMVMWRGYSGKVERKIPEVGAGLKNYCP